MYKISDPSLLAAVSGGYPVTTCMTASERQSDCNIIGAIGSLSVSGGLSIISYALTKSSVISAVVGLCAAPTLYWYAATAPSCSVDGCVTKDVFPVIFFPPINL